MLCLLHLKVAKGSGKTTLIKALVTWLEAAHYVLTREPGGSEIAEKIRKIILDLDNKGIKAKTEALLLLPVGFNI